LKNFKLIKEQILSFQPEVVVFIDYPGFNLRMAEWTHKRGIKNAYYIAPQVWAWKENRVHKMRKYIDQLCVSLPFEKEYYESRDVNTSYVGHPLLEGISSTTEDKKSGKNTIQTIALLPGSRKQEIKKMLPVMLKALESLSNVEGIIAGAPNIDADFYRQWTKNNPRISLLENKTYDLLLQADYALVTSGTATLETALFQVPQIVLYKGNWLSYQIAKRFVKVKYISLVNLILNRQVVPELIQNDVKPRTVASHLKQLMTQHQTDAQLEAYRKLRQLLDEGGASKLVAEQLVERLQA
jgi:lipid-A-disaccharide synthase